MFGGELLPLRSPLQVVPGNRLADFVSWLTGIVEFDFYDPGRVRRIFLNKCSRQAKVCESLDCFCAVSVSAQAAGWDALVPE